MKPYILLVLLQFHQIFCLQWFFDPYDGGHDEMIQRHLGSFPSRLGSQKIEETDKSDYSSRGRSLKLRRSDDSQAENPTRAKFARQLSFNFRPWESLARNLNFNSPSNTFCMSKVC